MWPEDASIALTYLELSAHALGVGACWGGFLTAAIRNFEGLREFLGTSSEEHICGAQMLGYPMIVPLRQFPKRKPLNISWIK
jgi:nitroreductase